MTVSRGDCYSQDTLHGHRVAAIAPVLEKATGAMPLTMIEGCGMYVIFTLELCFKTGELDALWFFRVTFGFGNFANHT
jgi:hypothetical protein